MSVEIHEPAPPTVAATPAATAAPQTPTQKVVAAANQVHQIVDANGRPLAWRKLSTLEEFDFLEICGTSATNPAWMVMALCAQAVVEIAGERVARPANKAQLRARVQLLGDEGIAAVQRAIMPALAEDGAEGETSAQGELERAKN